MTKVRISLTNANLFFHKGDPFCWDTNSIARITKLFRPVFKRTLVLVKPVFKKYRPILNIINY